MSASADYARDLLALPDAELSRLARGVASVERAVRRHDERTLWEPPIPLRVARLCGWPLCAGCARPVVPWQAIQWKRAHWHPSCASDALGKP